jgi:hypothetical protein
MEETVKKSKETAKDSKYYNELVTVKLFKDTSKYKDDVFVAVNGKGMIVPRGKEVKIPRKYAIALKNSEAQDSFAAEYQAELSKGGHSPEIN